MPSWHGSHPLLCPGLGRRNRRQADFVRISTFYIFRLEMGRVTWAVIRTGAILDRFDPPLESRRST